MVAGVVAVVVVGLGGRDLAVGRVGSLLDVDLGALDQCGVVVVVVGAEAAGTESSSRP
ncbi:hypothetical protein ABT288_23350 [Streptomyces sp. NPDC001093]|uniref:hypothetical protein n=1 Tax=Streptomyces sp. NPDC001093 TaxID=3154376 RepID=UPI0033305734